ncbi:hypothetical protein PVNG_05009 [Plasmodium vivax North Korean]|uniref:PIR Superfamily Protein n=1 Tax=Plasmodium vivax North Korean TaxID=1035514 RepID=A0A0J9U327_PLAVI|nr:hypothetical protein PVNG_05009 [Plasmodium vivax North Korean]
MAGDEETYKLNDFINDKLNQSNLNTFYQSYFETECDDSKISNSYCYQDINFGTLPTALSELYRKFERNLILIWDDEENVYENWETDKKKICSYLKYWIYDQLISKNVSQADFSQIFKLWNERKSGKCSNCEYEFNIKHFSQVKMLKKAYDYSLFLKAYKKTAKINKQIYNMNYCRYVEDAKAIYTLLGDTCEKSTAENCKEFNKYVLPYVKYKDSGRYKFVEENEDTEVDEDAEKGEDDSAISCKVHLTTDPDREEKHEEMILKECKHNAIFFYHFDWKILVQVMFYMILSLCLSLL